MDKQPCVYIMTSIRNGTLYTGVTSNIIKRIWEHRNAATDGFTRKYKVHKLVWFETHETMDSAIQREKNIKNWRRSWKIEMIEKSNPGWDDLYPTLL